MNVTTEHGYRKIGQHFGIDPDTIVYCVERDDETILGLTDENEAELVLRVVNETLEIPQAIRTTEIGENPTWTVFELSITHINIFERT